MGDQIPIQDFLVEPIQGTDLVAFYRKSRKGRPLYIPYSRLLQILSGTLNTSGLILQTNGVPNPRQDLANLVAGSGMTITALPNGNIVFTSSGGTSYITSTSNTADINLSVTGGALSAVLTSVGTAGTYGNGTQVPQITIDSKGRVTGVTLVTISAGGVGTVTSVGLSMPAAFSVSGSPITGAGTFTVTGAGTTAQYIRGDGTLDTFPSIPSITPAALSKVDDTNVSLTLGGTPLTALLQSVSLTLGWIGRLAKSRVFSVASGVILGRSTAGSGDIEELTATKSVVINAGNVELDGDQAIPASPGVYGIAGTKGWRSDASVRGDKPVAWVTEQYVTTTNQTGVLYVPSVSKLYVCNNSSNTVTIYSTTSGATLNTVSVTGAFQAFYSATSKEVYITSSSLTTINIISTGAFNNSLGTISGATANGAEAIEFSSTKMFICVTAASGSIMVLNPSTNTITSTITTSVPANPIGMCLNTNVSSLQYNKIIISAGGGLAIFDPTTNSITTTVANPSSAISSGRTIKYITSTDQYVLVSVGNAQIQFFSIATATTFTLSAQIYQMSGIQDLDVDETYGYVFATTFTSSSMNSLFFNIIDLSTKVVKLIMPTPVTCGASSAAGKMYLDLPNKRLFLVGRSSVANLVCSVKYV